MNKSIHLLPLLVLIGCASLSACGTPQPQVSPIVSPIESPLKVTETAKGIELPPGTIRVGESLQFDFDGDGQPETAVAYAPASGGPGGGVIIVTKPSSGNRILWQTQIPSDLTLTELKARNMLANGIYEILIFTHRDGTVKFPLYVYEWANGNFVLLKPNGGKLAGQDAFVSDYWPTTLGDVDDDSIMEIVPTLELDPPVEYLEPIVYQWDGNNFTYNDFFIVPPRFKPEK